jgi:hypothetical protein
MEKSFVMSVLKDDYIICRLDAFEGIPEWIKDSPFYSITQTSEELSVVCEKNTAQQKLTCEEDWKCMRIHGPLGFSETGIISTLTSMLAQNDISVFVISTYETDYILLKKMNLAKAAKILTDAGHEVYYD